MKRRQLFIRAPTRHQCHGPLGRGDEIGGSTDGRRQGDDSTVHQRQLSTLTLEDPGQIARLIAHPRTVHERIVQRRDAVDACIQPPVKCQELPLALAVPDVDAAAALAPRANRRRGLEIPHARVVQQLARQQRAHWTNVNHVIRVCVVIEIHVGRRTYQRMIATVLHTQRVRLGDFRGEAHTP